MHTITSNVYSSRGFVLCLILFVTLFLVKAGCSPTDFCTEDQQEKLQAIESLDTLEGCITSSPYLNLSTFEFEPRLVPYNDSACLALHMFRDMGFIHQLNISVHALSRFIQKAQKGYNQIPYHNWHHGFGLLHFVYVVLKNCHLLTRQHLTSLEGLALMTAAMCHDIDHKGLDNRFHKLTNSSLARLYASFGSIMERHHINVTLTILQNPDSNFIANLKEEDAGYFKKIIELAILATDLPQHLKLLDEERQMVTVGFDRHNQGHRDLIMSLIMSCGDLSDHTKSWTSAHRIVSDLFVEFFAEGDEEKRQGLVPPELMDRDKLDIPSSQVKFLSSIVIPTFRILSTLYNETSPSLHRAEKNLENWQTSIAYFRNLEKIGKDKLSILNDSSLDGAAFV